MREGDSLNMDRVKKQIKKWGVKKIAIALLLFLGFIIGFLMPQPTIIWPRQLLSADEAIEVIALYLTREMGEDLEIIITSIEDINSLYKIKLSVDGEKFLSYLTKDGSLLFPTALNLSPPGERLLPLAQRPQVRLSTMALSPFGNFVQEHLIEAVSWFGDTIDFSLHYTLFSDLGEENCLDEDQRYCSPEGVVEIEQVVRELCVAKHQPDQLINFVLASNQLIDPGNHESLLAHADKIGSVIVDTGLDVDQLNNCFQEEKFELLEEQLVFQNQKYLVRVPEYYVDAFGDYQTESVVGRNDSCLIINEMIYGQSRELHHLKSEDYRDIICLSFSKRRQPEICRVLPDQEDFIEEVPDEEIINIDTESL